MRLEDCLLILSRNVRGLLLQQCSAQQDHGQGGLPDPGLAELEQVERILQQLSGDAKNCFSSSQSSSMLPVTPLLVDRSEAEAAQQTAAKAGSNDRADDGSVLDARLQSLEAELKREVAQLRMDVEGFALDLEDLRARKDMVELRFYAGGLNSARGGLDDATMNRTTSTEPEPAAGSAVPVPVGGGYPDDDGDPKRSSGWDARGLAASIEEARGASSLDARLVALEEAVGVGASQAKIGAEDAGSSTWKEEPRREFRVGSPGGVSSPSGGLGPQRFAESGGTKFEKRLVKLEDRIFQLQLDTRLTSVPALTGEIQSAQLKLQMLEASHEELRSVVGEQKHQVKYIENRVMELEVSLPELKEKQGWWDERWKEVARTVRFQLDEASASFARTREELANATTKLKAETTAAVAKQLVGEVSEVSSGLEECRAVMRELLRIEDDRRKKEEKSIRMMEKPMPLLSEWNGYSNSRTQLIAAEDATTTLKRLL